MSPGDVPMSDVFWSHMPSWVWPIIAIGIVGFCLYQAIKASEVVARCFGRVGNHIRGKATLGKRTLNRIERIGDDLDCAITYLVDDADWHNDADVIIAERCPKVMNLLPARIPFTEYQRRWRAGWRPAAYEES